MAFVFGTMFQNPNQRVIGSTICNTVLETVRIASSVTAQIGSSWMIPACKTVIVKPMWIIARQVRALRRQRERVPPRKRNIVPSAAALARQRAENEAQVTNEVITGPITERKRGLDADVEASMKSIKRRRYNYQPPKEWANQEWYQEHAKSFEPYQTQSKSQPQVQTQRTENIAQNLAKQRVEEEHKLPTPTSSPSPELRPRPSFPVQSTYKAGKYRYAPYSKTNRPSEVGKRVSKVAARAPKVIIVREQPSLTRAVPPPYPFWLLGESETDIADITELYSSIASSKFNTSSLLQDSTSIKPEDIKQDQSIAQPGSFAHEDSIIQDPSLTSQESIISKHSLSQKQSVAQELSVIPEESIVEEPATPKATVIYIPPVAKTPNDITMLDATGPIVEPTPISKIPTPPPSDHSEDESEDEQEEATAGDPMLSVKKEGSKDVEAKEWRRYMRATSYGSTSQGFKDFVDGTMSPEARTFNAEHRIKLLRAAMKDGESPSSVPKEPSATSQDQSGFNMASFIDEIAIPEPEPEPEYPGSPIELVTVPPTPIDFIEIGTEFKPEENTRNTTPTPAINIADISAEDTSALAKNANAVVEEDSSILQLDERPLELLLATPKVTKKVTIPKTPANQILPTFQDLSVTTTRAKGGRSTAFETLKSERVTRHQKKQEEIEASKDQYKIVELNDEYKAKVKKAVREGVRDSDGSSRYSTHDLAKVVPQYASYSNSSWLNDAVVNDYLSMVVKHGNQGDRPKQVPTYATFSSFAWTKIKENPKSLPTRWAKKQGIQGRNALECEKIFFPINTGSHWLLCLAEPKAKKVTTYNSMRTYGSTGVAGKILEYLESEVGATFKKEEWTIVNEGLSPQQDNGDDCGVFTITTARQIMLGQMEKSAYTGKEISYQRERIVAELVERRLLTAQESGKN